MNLLKYFLFASLILTQACGGGGDDDDPAPQEEEVPSSTTGGTNGGAKFDVILDSDLTNPERISLQGSIKLLEAMEIDGSKISGFNQIFKGGRSSHVVSYLESRVNYIIPENSDIDQRLIRPASRVNNLATFASNASSLFWYLDAYYKYRIGKDVQFLVSNIPREIDSSRIGIVQLGDIFVPSDSITQAITLVHEARHSDCPGGALLSDIIGFGEYDQGPQNADCGQLHTGPGGSDPMPWGPYAIDYIYSKAISDTCTSCTITQRTMAQANANDTQARAYKIIETMNGVFGPPNMTSSNRIKDDL